MHAGALLLPSVATRVLCVALAALLCAQCAAIGKPATKPPVPMPALSSEDHDAWRAYFDHLFEQLRGKVAEPSAEYPETAQHAYREAKAEWEKTQRGYRRTETAVIFIVLVGVVAILVLSGPSIGLDFGGSE